MRNKIVYDMTTKSTNIHIPKLRFPEFQNEREWEVKRLGEIVKDVDDKCSINELQIETYISTENMLQNLEGVKKASKLPETGSFTCFKKGDILFSNIRPYLKKVWQAEFDGAASNDVIVFRALNGFDYHFVSQIIKSDSFIAHTMAGAKGVKMPRGDKNMMMDYIVCIPSLAEQQRIAACLSALDEMLSATKDKLEQLKAYKKGLMQKLFPAHGKTLPELRFKEFEKDGEWEEKMVKQVCSIGTGKSNSQDQVNDGVYPFFIRSEHPVKSNKYLYDCEAVITIGDGKIGQVFHYINGKFDLHQRCYKMSDFQGVDGKYFYYFFSTHFYERAMRMTAKATVDSVRLEMISDMPIFVPSLSEQHKIADCLTLLDEMINQYTNKVRFLEVYKKGLMQQMFPTSK